jgi:2-keto-4-pentenoate hydratase
LSTVEAAESAALATLLRAAHRHGELFTPLTVDGTILTLPDAYDVQEAHVHILQRELASDLAGYKVGLTSRTMQEMCGIAHPVYGGVLARRVAHASRTLRLDTYAHLGVEFEIAVRLGADLKLEVGADATSHTAECIDAVACALELVDDRLADYACLDAASLVADNAWNEGIVLGPWSPLVPQLAGAACEVSCDDEVLENGLVGAAADHPVASVAWLARALAQRGRHLLAGMVVMTGSVARTRFPVTPGTWRFAVTGFGAVELCIEG